MDSARGMRFVDEEARLAQAGAAPGTEEADAVARLERRLRASRQATRQIFAAEGPQSLIERTCRTFVETLGYAHAWIALLAEDGRTVTSVAVEGLGDRACAMRQRLAEGACQAFIERTIDAPDLFVVRQSLPECAACPLSQQYLTCAGLARELRFEGRLYGVVSVSVSNVYAHDPEEQGFFVEMSENIAYALYRMEQDQDLRVATEIVDTSPTVALVWEGTPDRVVRYASRNAERLLGYSAEALMSGGMAFADLVHPDDVDRVLAETEAASANPDTTWVQHKAYRIVDRSGTVKWIQDMTTIERAEDGGISSYRGLLLDVSDRRLAEERLRQSERFLDSLVNGIADPIFVKDTDHRWIALNDAFCEMFGRTREEMLGKSDRDFFPPEQVEVFWKHDDRVLASDEVDTNEEEISGLDGLRIISTTKAAFTHPATGQRVLVGTIRDITEQKAAENALRQREGELRRAQRIAKLGSWHLDEKMQILYASEEMMSLFEGVSDRDAGISVEAWKTRIHPDDLPRVEEALAKARSGEAAYDIEYRLVRVDGAVRMLHVQGEVERDDRGVPVRMEGTAQDITERRRVQEQLRASRNQLHSIFDQTFQFAGIIAPDGTLMDANQTSLRFIASTAADLVGTPFWLTPWWSHDLQQQRWLEASIAKAVRGEAVQHEVTHVSRAGDLHYFDFSLKPIFGQAGRVEYLIAESRDVTERKHAERRTKRLFSQQVAINALYAALGDEQDPEGVYRTLHEHVSRMMPTEQLTIALLDASGERMRVAFRVKAGAIVNAALGADASIDEPSLALSRQVVRSGLPIWADGTGIVPEADTEEPAASGGANAGSPVSQLLVPMKIDGAVMGVLDVRSGGADAYRREEADLLGGLANVAAMAIERARLQARSLAAASELRAVFQSTIEILARATERRDPYTAGHQLRVAVLSTEIARALGLSDEEVETVRFAAMVHDIGKLSIPAEILSRPSALNAMEYRLVQAHVEAARDILDTVDFPWPVADIVSQHHERMDGSGYPAGLKGDGIMIEARILAVADVVEAMSHHRPYRPSLGIDAALEEIRSNKGVCFDRDVVDACLRVFETGFAFPEGVGD